MAVRRIKLMSKIKSYLYFNFKHAAMIIRLITEKSVFGNIRKRQKGRNEEEFSETTSKNLNVYIINKTVK